MENDKSTWQRVIKMPKELLEIGNTLSVYVNPIAKYVPKGHMAFLWLWKNESLFHRIPVSELFVCARVFVRYRHQYYTDSSYEIFVKHCQMSWHRRPPRVVTFQFPAIKSTNISAMRTWKVDATLAPLVKKSDVLYCDMAAAGIIMIQDLKFVLKFVRWYVTKTLTSNKVALKPTLCNLSKSSNSLW